MRENYKNDHIRRFKRTTYKGRFVYRYTSEGLAAIQIEAYVALMGRVPPDRGYPDFAYNPRSPKRREWFKAYLAESEAR
jgi:hypothetical protein